MVARTVKTADGKKELAKPITVHLPISLWHRAGAQASRQGRTIAAVSREILEKALAELPVSEMEELMRECG